MFYSPIPPEQYGEMVDKKNKEIESLQARCLILQAQYESLDEKLAKTGLTTEELQGIHELIQGQIKWISTIQSAVDSETNKLISVNEANQVSTLVNTLLSLASLVSKPTD